VTLNLAYLCHVTHSFVKGKNLLSPPRFSFLFVLGWIDSRLCMSYLFFLPLNSDLSPSPSLSLSPSLSPSFPANHASWTPSPQPHRPTMEVPDAEFHDPERRALITALLQHIKRLKTEGNVVNNFLPPVFWSCLWVSDMSCLRQIIERFQKDGFHEIYFWRGILTDPALVSICMLMMRFLIPCHPPQTR
jgi:hypothetical protein